MIRKTHSQEKKVNEHFSENTLNLINYFILYRHCYTLQGIARDRKEVNYTREGIICNYLH